MLLKNADKDRRKVTLGDFIAVGLGLLLGGAIMVVAIISLWGPQYLWMFRR